MCACCCERVRVYACIVCVSIYVPVQVATFENQAARLRFDLDTDLS